MDVKEGIARINSLRAATLIKHQNHNNMNSANTETEKEIFTDESLMPFGQFKGAKLANVPADHLLWLYRNERAGRLKDYILDNFELLEKEAAKLAKKGGKRW